MKITDCHSLWQFLSLENVTLHNLFKLMLTGLYYSDIAAFYHAPFASYLEAQVTLWRHRLTTKASPARSCASCCVTHGIRILFRLKTLASKQMHLFQTDLVSNGT